MRVPAGYPLPDNCWQAGDTTLWTSRILPVAAARYTMENGDESLRNLAEQMGYMQDLLRDFARGKNWVSARIVSPKGNPFVVSKGDAPLGEAQVGLVTSAVDRKTVVFGPVRVLGDSMVIDLADPMPIFPATSGIG